MQRTQAKPHKMTDFVSTGTMVVAGALLVVTPALARLYGSRMLRAIRGVNEDVPVAENPIQQQDVEEIRTVIDRQHRRQREANQALHERVTTVTANNTIDVWQQSAINEDLQRQLDALRTVQAANVKQQSVASQELQRQLDSLKIEQAKTVASMNKSGSKLFSARADIQTLRGNVERLTTANAQLQSRLDGSTTSLRRDVDRLTAANMELATIQSLQEDVQQLRANVTDLTANNTQLQSSVTRLTRQNTRLRNDVDSHVCHCCEEAGCFGEAGPVIHTAPATAPPGPAPPGGNDEGLDDQSAKQSGEATLPPQEPQSLSVPTTASRSGTPDASDNDSDGAETQDSPCAARHERRQQSSAPSTLAASEQPDEGAALFSPGTWHRVIGQPYRERSATASTAPSEAPKEEEEKAPVESETPQDLLRPLIAWSGRDATPPRAPATDPVPPVGPVTASSSQVEEPQGADVPLPLSPVGEPQGTLPGAPVPVSQDVPRLPQAVEEPRGADVPLPLSPVEEPQGTLPEPLVPVPQDVQRLPQAVEEQGADVPLPLSPVEESVGEPQSVASQPPAAQVAQQTEELPSPTDALPPSLSACSSSAALSMPAPSGPLYSRRRQNLRRANAQQGQLDQFFDNTQPAQTSTLPLLSFTFDAGDLEDSPAGPRDATPAVQDAPILNEVEMVDAPSVDEEILEDAPAEAQGHGNASVAPVSGNAINQAIPEPIDTDMANASSVDGADSDQDAEGESDLCPQCSGPLPDHPDYPYVCTERPCPKDCSGSFCTKLCLDVFHADVEMSNQEWDDLLLAEAESSNDEGTPSEPAAQDEQGNHDDQDEQEEPEDQDETDSLYAVFPNGNHNGEQDSEQDSQQDSEQDDGPPGYYDPRHDNRSPSFARSDDGNDGYNGTFMADDISRHGSRTPSFAPSDDEAGGYNGTSTADYQNNQTDSAFNEFMERNPQSPPQPPPQSAKRKTDSKADPAGGPSTAPVTQGPQRQGIEYGTSSSTGRPIVIPRRKNRGHVNVSMTQGTAIAVAGPSGTTSDLPAPQPVLPYYLPALPSTSQPAASSSQYPEDQLPPPRGMTVSEVARAERRRLAAQEAEQAEQADSTLLDFPELVDGASDEPLSTDPAGPSSAPSTVDPALVDPSLIDPALLDPSLIDPSLIDPSLIDPSLIDPSLIDPALLDPAGTPGTSGPSTSPSGGSSHMPSSSSPAGGAGANTPMRFDGAEGEYLPAKGRDEDLYDD